MVRMVAPVAGKVAPRQMLVNVPRLISNYYTMRPQKPVEFGTSGHRGSSLKGSFNEPHILAITQAICEYRVQQGINGPLYIGFDTHALSEPAFRSAMEVLAANGVETVIHKNQEYSPTPVISRMIIRHNAGRSDKLADGIIITPSHNGPQDGGFKYNPPNGGPADTGATSWIQNLANSLMQDSNQLVRRIPFEKALAARSTREEDFVSPFIEDLGQVINMEAIRAAGIKIGVDPMGGSGVNFWGPLAERYGLDIEVVNETVDPTFAFMTLDADKTIRMDCSSPYAMASLVSLKDRFQIAFGNDTDYDRHGIVTPDGLMNPNHYLSVAIWYLAQNRPAWSPTLKFGKTIVSSSMIDRVVAGVGRELYEVPVGFKWFVDGLANGWLGFGGEESAGASLLDMNGRVWTTDKDGFALGLLAAEILAVTGKTPSQIYNDILVPAYGSPYYSRLDGPITEEQKLALKALRAETLIGKTVAGLTVTSVLTKAPGNNAGLGGVKAILSDGSWFALRPSGTEPKMKLYIESFGGQPLWQQIAAEAPKLIFG